MSDASPNSVAATDGISRGARSRSPRARTDRIRQVDGDLSHWDHYDRYYGPMRHLWRAVQCAVMLRKHTELSIHQSTIVNELVKVLEEEKVRAEEEWKRTCDEKQKLREQWLRSFQDNVMLSKELHMERKMRLRALSVLEGAGQPKPESPSDPPPSRDTGISG